MSLENDVILNRFCKGSFSEFIYSTGGALYLTWDKGIHPLESGGNPHSKTKNRLETLTAFINKMKTQQTCYVSFGEKSNKNFLCIILEKGTCSFDDFHYPAEFKNTDFKIIERNIKFDSIMSALQKLYISFTPTGGITLEHQIVTTVEIPKWTLHKETYTNEEVQEILKQFKEEMVETTNQLMNRLINRIAK
ncbi:HNH homing endonuclease [Aeromonas phage AerS_266]|nr:HNH homing endonuclease [Aeromonas phage AerS_266]